MRRLALIVFAFVGLSAPGFASAPLHSVTSRAKGDVDRIETITAGAIPLVASAHPIRVGALPGTAPSMVVVLAFAMCVLVAAPELTRPRARSHEWSRSSRAPPSQRLN
jgi:hypothetical protein